MQIIKVIDHFRILSLSSQKFILMPFLETPIEGLLVFEPQVWEDDRGYFFESYNQQYFAQNGIHTVFVQDNEAKSTVGVLRGLHYQTSTAAQAKLVRVTEGEVFDVAVDLRPGSTTYGQWHGVFLSAQNKRQYFVPRGFAHGYLVISPTAVFCYKCDNFYDKNAEGGLCFDDAAIGVEWPKIEGKYLLSEKDKVWPKFGQHKI